MSKHNRTNERAVDFKSATLDTVRLVLQEADTDTMLQQLSQRLEDSQGFFAQEPVVIDASALSTAPSWAALIRCLESHQLHPIAVSAQGAIAASAQTAGLPLVSLGFGAGSQSTPPPSTPDTAITAVDSQPAAEPPTVDDTPPTASSASTNTQQPTMVIERQLRSGQRIYAQNSDLIVIGVVGQGAEIIADGNIHVYGPLRGRAMAGAQGNTEARIFTTELDPELIAIAGVYKVVEEPLPNKQHRKGAVIRLEDEHLKIEAIG